jgi:hypothetical protein
VVLSPLVQKFKSQGRLLRPTQADLVLPSLGLVGHKFCDRDGGHKSLPHEK